MHGTLPPVTITEHAERYLGSIADGFSVRMPARSLVIARFQGQPHQFASTFVTLGLSEQVLKQQSGRIARQELILCVPSSCDKESMFKLLGALAFDVSNSGVALARGQVLGPVSPLFEGASVSAFFCMAPMLFPDEFTVFRELQPPAIFVWLVPITEKEAEIARRLGADAFEERLEDWQQKENLLDLSRVGMVDV